MSKLDLRAAILATNDRRTRDVTVPEWNNATIRLRGSSVAELARLQEQGEDVRKLYPALIIASVLDPETNEPLFTEADRDALTDRSAVVMERLATIIGELNGEGKATAEAIEGNSEPTGSGTSGSN